MLLPSALTCDSSHSSHPPLTRLQSALFASPPASPPQISSAHNAIDNIFHTCRSLQALLASTSPLPSTPPMSHSQLPTPPMAHTPSPMKLRLRSHRPCETTTGLGISTDNPVKARKKIVKRSAPARGPNKRRRGADDDMGRDDDDVESDLDIETYTPPEAETSDEPARPATPKRARIAPEVIPLGLERSDFHTLHASSSGGLFGDAASESQIEGSDVVVEADGEKWSTEDDRILVELVLEKLKLTKSDWQDCARSLGKDRGSLGRRWKSLMISGEVGLKRSSRRSKIHGTWR
ncbi:hypothetical protein GE09DRAFT_325797 [Coniochaeta sp. 2T2.1]|nr:hypothetical protein GE09DRAFT_325797 [Coniochaeta sp. 2T2.1]